MKNRIKALRKALQLSQRALAEKVGVSQQHIQRIESSEQIQVGFALAMRLSQALGQPLDAVFPQTKKTLRRLSKRESADPAAALFYDRKVQEEMKNAGINMDARQWFLRTRLRDRKEEIDIRLADGEYERLWEVLQTSDVTTIPFVVVDAGDGYRYAVQQKHLLAWHFMFEVFGTDVDKPTDDERVRIWFADGTPAVEIDGTPDEPSDFHDTGPLDYIFSMLEMLNDGERNSFSMMDSAGEVFWFCADEVALFAAPLSLMASDQDEDDRDDDHAERGAAKPATQAGASELGQEPAVPPAVS